MSMILAWLSGKGSALALGAALPLIFIAAGKMIPKYAASLASGALGKGMAGIDKLEDPKEKELVHAIAVAVVKWAEYKIPDAGQGRARFEAAAGRLCAMVPFLKGRDKDVANIIEKAVAAMDAELHKIN